MNKKLMTLGVAAAVGLAGFAALPVLAATPVWLKKAGFEKPTTATLQEDGKYLVTIKGVYGNSGIVTVDDATSAIEKTEIKDFLKGKKAYSGEAKATESEALDEANWKTPAVTPGTVLTVRGDAANVLGALKATADDITDTDDAYKNLKTIVLDLRDYSDNEVALAGLNDAAKILDDFPNAKMTIKLVPSVNSVDLKDVEYASLKDYDGRIKFETPNKIKTAKDVAEKRVLDVIGLSSNNWESYDANYYERTGNQSGNSSSAEPNNEKPKDPKAPNTNGGSTTGDKNSTQSPKAPNTGIAE